MFLFLLNTLNWSLAAGSLLLLVVTLVLYVDFFFYGGKHTGSLVKQFAWPLIIGVTVGSVAMSLLYSEYFGFIPCSLCWLQRIAIYPQALLSIIALKTGDKLHFPIYGIALSVLGFLVAAYQYIYQMLPRETGGSSILPCLADGSNADCAIKVIDAFGFVTFPFISAVSFAFLIVIYLNLRRYK